MGAFFTKVKSYFESKENFWWNICNLSHRFVLKSYSTYCRKSFGTTLDIKMRYLDMRSKKLWIFRFESYSIGCPRSTKSRKNNLPILSLKILVGLSPYYFLLESFPSIYCCKVYTYAGNNCPIKLYHVQASWPPVTEGKVGA